MEISVWLLLVIIKLYLIELYQDPLLDVEYYLVLFPNFHYYRMMSDLLVFVVFLVLLSSMKRRLLTEQVSTVFCLIFILTLLDSLSTLRHLTVLRVIQWKKTIYETISWFSTEEQKPEPPKYSDGISTFLSFLLLFLQCVLVLTLAIGDFQVNIFEYAIIGVSVVVGLIRLAPRARDCVSSNFILICYAIFLSRMIYTTYILFFEFDCSDPSIQSN